MMPFPDIKGWCPGAHRPMVSGDGLVVRVRPWFGRISRQQAHGLADLATQFGSGVIEATSRANLQLRGVETQGFDDLLHGLERLELLDADPSIEHVRNIVLNPFWAHSDRFDQMRMAQALTAALARPELAALPSKFGFVIDAGQERHLGDTSGDIRVEAAHEGLIVRAQGSARGRLVRDEDEAVETALRMAEWFLGSGGVGSDGRGRMHRHLENVTLPDDLTGGAEPNPSVSVPALGAVGAGLHLGFAFGQITAEALHHLADRSTDDAPLRITPFRTVFLPQTDALAEHPDVLTSDTCGLRRITACAGAPFCVQASVQTRDLGRLLAPKLSAGQHLHISGCAKGCAHPKACELTLVGRAGAFDLVRHGAPWDEADHAGLREEDILNLIGR